MGERKASIQDHMQRQHAESWPILSGLSKTDLDQPVYSGENPQWTVKDVLGHLADSERGLLGQVSRLVAGAMTVPDDFDLDRWNRSAVRKGSDIGVSQLLKDIENAYQDALNFLAELDEGVLDLRGRHASGRILSAERFFLQMADHRAQHAADISASLRR